MAGPHLTLANLIKTCEVASLNAPYSAIMKSVGASENLCYHWRTQSLAAERAGEKENCIWWFEWRQGQWGYWHHKISQARIDFITGYEADLRHECRYGREEVVLGPDQQVVFKLDPKLIGVDEGAFALLGIDHRYLLDDDGMPIPLTKTVFPPPAIRLRILEQDKRYLATQSVDVNLRAQVVHTSQPMQRLPSERADLVELRRLAKIPPTHPFPLDAHGNRTIPQLTAPHSDDRSDHVRDQQPIPPPVNPRMYEAPPLNPPNAPKPSYAKPTLALDQASTGRGSPPDGGFKVA